MQTIAICLAFDKSAEAAVNIYVPLFARVFGNSRIIGVSRYGKEELSALREVPDVSQDIMPGPVGSVKTIRFELNGQQFIAVNGGGYFGKFNESSSVYVNCDTQDQIDGLWETLSDQGTEQTCGWLRDKFGVSWQIAPTFIWEIEEGSDYERSQRLLQALYQMKKINLEVLRNA